MQALSSPGWYQINRLTCRTKRRNKLNQTDTDRDKYTRMKYKRLMDWAHTHKSSQDDIINDQLRVSVHNEKISE